MSAFVFFFASPPFPFFFRFSLRSLYCLLPHGRIRLGASTAFEPAIVQCGDVYQFAEFAVRLLVFQEAIHAPG